MKTLARSVLADPLPPDPRFDPLPAGNEESRAGTRSRLEADARIRTADPFITSEVLYQLSYVGEISSLATLHSTGTSSKAVCRSCESSNPPQSGGLSLRPRDWYKNVCGSAAGLP